MNNTCNRSANVLERKMEIGENRNQNNVLKITENNGYH